MRNIKHQLLLALPNPMRVVTASHTKNTHLFAMLNRWIFFGHVISHSSRMHKGCYGVGIHLASAVYYNSIQRFSFIPSVWQVDVAI